MAAHRRKSAPHQALKGSNDDAIEQKTSMSNKGNDQAAAAAAQHAQLVHDHLPPLILVLVVMACSGLLFVFALRDFLATGRNIAGPWDEAMLFFTKSTVFFSNEKGWKSQQGGLSSIQQVTTDANNMGGLFVRKVGGAASLAVQTLKLLPLLFHPRGAMWNAGHFRPLLLIAAITNVCLAVFYATYIQDFAAGGAEKLPVLFIGALVLETTVMVLCLFRQPKMTAPRTLSVALPEGKTPTSVTSRIVSRTVLLVSGFRAVVAARDLFAPGQIIDIIPRDDIYLEWTGAFLHSPPQGSQEEEENVISSPLYIGDLFLSQFMALNMLILCLYKFVSVFIIRYGRDGSGVIKCKMIWKGLAIGDVMITLLFRLFAPAAMSASLDLRWHLMAFGYETFILGLYAFF